MASFQKYHAINSVNDVSSCQGIVHQSPLHCLQEFTLKLLATGKVSFKYYLIFHAIPLVMRMRKCRNITQALKALTSTAIDYLKSILFLSFLVGLERGSLCLFLSFPQRYTPTSCIISSTQPKSSSAQHWHLQLPYFLKNLPEGRK